MQLHVDLLAGAGHITTNCELIFHFPESFGQGRLLPASDLPSGFSMLAEFIILLVRFIIQLPLCVPNTLLSEHLLVAP